MLYKFVLLQTFIHYLLHFGAIGIIAYVYWPKKWFKAYLILFATMLVDVDHLWANPIFDPDRCSIGFHTFHSYPMIAVYFLGAIFVKHAILRLIFIGLLFHMFTDGLDCLWNAYL
ncbi:hypothetical protein GCM10010832_25200 [Psychroflexus planctonicus]|uniref:LexA-binding, inner membrane-associated hydrolase n=1 Tax=Psychroflexus planctonicus TaxID=1526575 RepID=A0ABQ1SKR9_9FLAO|nr:hypothetical protein GCM10010832_25200 [Psychroflexus planctonicus]